MTRDPIRPAILNMMPNAIGQVAWIGLGDPSIIPLWFGETDLVTPDFIREATKRALDDGRTFYASAGGIPALREGIRDFTTRWYGMTLDLDRIWVPGAAMLCVVTALQCCVETGDEVIVVAPMWPNITQAAQAVGATPVYVRLDHDKARGCWALDLGKLEAAMGPRTKAVFIGTPGNPTGWTISPEEIQAVMALCARWGVAIIADEVYSTLYYAAKRAPSFIDFAGPHDNVFVVNSFSKAWAMTGWRIGWLVAPLRLANAMRQLSVSNNTGATVFAQYGAVAAINDGDGVIVEMGARCRKGRAIVADFIATQNRLSWVEPEGAFYAYIKVDGLTGSTDFAIDLVKRFKVGVAPGAAFACGPGDMRDEGYLRLCFAQSPHLLEEGLSRIASALR